MSFYSSIDRRINADRWFSALPPMAQWLWFRLLTGPHVTPVAGLWPATEEQLAKAFDITRGVFRKHYGEIAGKPERPTGKVYADWSVGVIWFPRAIHVPANQPRNENSLRGWSKHIELVPECKLRDVALAEIVAWVEASSGEGKRFPNGLPACFPRPGKRSTEPSKQPTLEQLTKQFREPLSEPPGKPTVEHVPRANQDQDQDQDQDQEHSNSPPPVVPAGEQRQQPSPLDSRVSCPGDLTLTPEQRATLQSGGNIVPGWAIDEITRRFVAKSVADPSDRRDIVHWRKCLVIAVSGDWNDPNKRPKKPQPEAQEDENGGYGASAEFT